MNAKTFNIKDYKSIQDAVNACAGFGGGKVIVPDGEWETKAIHLSSNIELHLENNAILRFSDVPEDYLPVVFTRWEGAECYNYSPLIYANGCENISITGNGTIIGRGESWWDWKKLQQKAADELIYAEYNKIPVEERIFGTREAALRPQFIQPINCKNVLLEGFKILNGPQWTIHPVYCENVIIRNVTVISKGHNTDGLNPDSCKNVLIEGCTFDTGDDCIAINSGINEDGWRVNKPCENIEIRNCKMFGGHGGIVIGSAVSGGVKNVYAHDCVINDTMQGIRIKSMRGRGGYVSNARFENIEVNDATDQAIQITMFYEFSTVIPKTETPSNFSDIEIKSIKGSSQKTGIQIKGLPEHKLNNLTLEDIDIRAKDALVCNDVKSMNIQNVIITEGE